MIHRKTVLVIVGSVRARRICPGIAAWVAEIGRDTAQADIEILDLKDWPLPMDDEPGVPAVHPHAHAHTRAFGEKIAAAGGFVFVAPQYNWGYPAVLKNALDHLYKEWSGKPAMIVTYGGHGGGRCARQLREVLKGLHMKPVRTMPGLTISHAMIEANEGVVDPAATFAAEAGSVRRAFAQLDRRLRGWWWW